MQSAAAASPPAIIIAAVTMVIHLGFSDGFLLNAVRMVQQ
jgi:hypothetical protein